MLPYYRTINFLNLDVVAGALLCSLFAEKALRVTVDTNVLNVCLAISVWLVYTIDRLIDTKKEQLVKWNLRHLFHKKYARQLWIAVVVLFTIDVLLAVTLLPYTMLVFGMLMIAVVVAYLIAVNMLDGHGHKWFQKEPLIALVYTAGVWGSKLWLCPAWDSRTLVLVVVPFFLLALMNLLVFSYFETDHDLQNKQRSLSVLWGSDMIGKIIMVLFALLLTFNYAIVKVDATPENLMISVTRTSMGFVLFALFYRSDFFYDQEMYRLVGDAAFLIPAVPLLLYY